MTNDFDKLLAEFPPTEADRAWAKSVLGSSRLRSPMAREITRTQFKCQFHIAFERAISARKRSCKRQRFKRVWHTAAAIRAIGYSNV